MSGRLLPEQGIPLTLSSSKGEWNALCNTLSVHPHVTLEAVFE